MKRALVLGGGGAFGVAWEVGFLTGLAKAGVNIRRADFILGTSAGSQVGTLAASELGWDEIWRRQIEGPYQGTPPEALASVFQAMAPLQHGKPRFEDFLKVYAELADRPHFASEAERLDGVAARLEISDWPARLGVVAYDIPRKERVLLTPDSRTALIPAVSASSALPGIWPAITVAGRRYVDGGIYSMENADLARGHDRVLILAPSLPIPTPHSLDEAVSELEAGGSRVLTISPDASVKAVLKAHEGNALSAEIRGPLARAAREQGQAEAAAIAAFWD